MTNVSRPFALVAAGGLAWWLGGIFYENAILGRMMIGLALVTLGFALAAWRAHDSARVAVGGIAVAVVGMLLFIGTGLFNLNNAARIGSHVFTLGAIAMAIGVFDRPVLARVGAALGIIGCIFWIVADAEPGGWAWQPGNLLALAGLAWLAARPERGSAAPSASSS